MNDALEKNIVKVIAPMAGITNGQFCRKFAFQGFDMVTIGGYNVDAETIEAGEEIIGRGRSEFNIPQKDIIRHIKEQIKIIREDNPWNGMISVNLRAVTPSPMVDISKLSGLDVVEINAHCRQPEIMDLGCGQSLLNNPDKLHDFTQEVVNNAESKVSVKIRANVQGTDMKTIVKSVEDAGADYLHVDAMKPGHPHADYDIISSIREYSDIFLIGNNSINDLESAQKMLNTGADGFSIARGLLNGKIPFDLSSI